MQKLTNLIPMELIKPLPIELEPIVFEAENPVKCEAGRIQATCDKSGVL